ncbi:sperm axonemal maintenance protein CFAP97D1 isoform X1 [Pseudophryne corroboree]|uniref:sperm axonemal maintenance protein CFAP97D1 isoform X1 n=1 Tax=Pseudophryne corroboree TaxID=495146 RepID=UPI003081E389
MNTVDYLAFPAIVSNQRKNNTLKIKWDNYHYQCHMSRVRNAKSEIDNKPPWIPLHHCIQMKKIQMEKERLAVIERANQLLLGKISQIMRGPGAVDNWNTCYLWSLSRRKCNKDIVRITTENQKIYKRIEESKPSYDHKKWEDEWKDRRMR